MFTNHDESEAAKQHTIPPVILLVLALFILCSQPVMAAGISVPLSVSDDSASAKKFQDCMANDGYQTTLPNGGHKCCYMRHCTSCTAGKCTTICRVGRVTGCTIILKENIEGNPTAPSVMAPTKPPTLPPTTGPTIPPNKPPTSPLVAPARDTSQPSTGISLPTAVMRGTPTMTRAFTPSSSDSETTNGYKCEKVVAGNWVCTKDGKEYYCTEKGKNCAYVKTLPKDDKSIKGRVNTGVMQQMNTGTRVQAPTTSTKSIEESPQGGYTPIGSPELQLNRMKR